MGGTLSGCCEKRDKKKPNLMKKKILSHKRLNPIN